MNIGGETVPSEISFDGLLNPSDPEETGADVILWMGPKKEPIYAHSNILRNASDYYKAAFSSRWKKVIKEKVNTSNDEAVDLDASSDTIVVSKDEESSVTCTTPTSTSCSTPSTLSSGLNLNNMYEVHHPEYEKSHMIYVLHYMYRVATVVPAKDVLDVALIANHLLMTKLQEKSLSYIAESAENVHTYAFRLYLLAATVFSESNTKLMSLALEVIFKDFDKCLNADPDVASLGQREMEALLMGLPLTPKQKWILLIIWAVASTGTIYKYCWYPLHHVFKESSWTNKLNDSCKEAVRDLIHLIPFSKFNRTDYMEYVQKFHSLGLLHADLSDFLMGSFESEKVQVQDAQLVANVKLHEPLTCLLSLSFPLTVPIQTFIYEKLISSRGKMVSRELNGLESDTVYKGGIDCRKTTPLKVSPKKARKSVHILQTQKGAQAAVIVDADQTFHQVIYIPHSDIHLPMQSTQPGETLLTNCVHYDVHARPYNQLSSQPSSYKNCDCRGCPTYIELKTLLGIRVKYPSSLQGEPIQDYVIYYF